MLEAAFFLPFVYTLVSTQLGGMLMKTGFRRLGYGAVLMLIMNGAMSFEYQVAFTAEQIQAHVNPQLPVKQNAWVADVTLEEANIELLETKDKLGIAGEVTVQAVGDIPREGRLYVESGVRYDPKQGAFFLQDMAITEWEVDGVSVSLTGQLAPLLGQMLNQVFATHPIYTLDDKDVNQQLVKGSLKSIRIEKGQLVAVMEL